MGERKTVGRERKGGTNGEIDGERWRLREREGQAL